MFKVENNKTINEISRSQSAKYTFLCGSCKIMKLKDTTDYYYFFPGIVFSKQTKLLDISITCLKPKEGEIVLPSFIQTFNLIAGKFSKKDFFSKNSINFNYGIKFSVPLDLPIDEPIYIISPNSKQLEDSMITLTILINDN